MIVFHYLMALHYALAKQQLDFKCFKCVSCKREGEKERTKERKRVVKIKIIDFFNYFSLSFSFRLLLNSSHLSVCVGLSHDFLSIIYTFQ